jgi:multiple sugar transport system permease protein
VSPVGPPPPAGRAGIPPLPREGTGAYRAVPKRERHVTGRVLLYAALALGALVALGPMLWMVSASLMPAGEASTYPPRLIPREVTLDHYRALFTRLNLGRYLLNSTIVATLVTAASLFVNAMAGYAFAKLRFRGRDRTFRLLTIGLVIPSQVAMLPLFLLLKQLGLVNTYWGVVIPGLASIFGIFLVRQYALSIPDDLLDAARVDGAGEFRLFWSVVLPVVRPILATLSIWTFLATWNDFMWPLIVLSDDRRYTLPVAIANRVGEHVQDTELMMAGSVLTVLPVLVVFLVLQRYYIQGVMAGSVK